MARNELREYLTSAQMCEEWRCKIETLMSYIDAGMPYETGIAQNGRMCYLYDLKACQQWYRTSGGGG